MIVERVLTETGIGLKENIIFSANDKQKYINRFLEAKKLLFIHNDTSFYNTNWIYRKGGVLNNITFFSEVELKNICDKNKLNINYKNLDLAFKYFMIEIICKFSNSTVFGTCKGIKKILLNPSCAVEVLEKNYEIGLTDYINIIDFFEFSMIDIISESDLNRILNLDIKKSYESKRLPNFASIFDFIDIIEHFYLNASSGELSRYYPIILWWKISSVIPLRPSEILATEYNCLIKQNEKYFMNIRRSKGKEMSVLLSEGATVEGYYYRDNIEITSDVYNFINKYKAFLKQRIDDTKIEFLFSKKLYIQSKCVNYVDMNEQIITSKQLFYLLDDFYATIIQNKYNKIPCRLVNGMSMKDIDNDKYIDQLRPYDSRHIAIINLIILGNEPQTVMKLAGHHRMRTTQGYYNHIEEYCDAYSISFAKKMKLKDINKSEMITSDKCYSAQADLELVLNQYSHKVEGGICSYALKDFQPCYKVEGKHYKCPYFICSDKEKLNNDIIEINNELKNEIEILKDIVEHRNSMSDFSERYSVITESIGKKIIDKAITISKSLN
jgi:integrase